MPHCPGNYLPVNRNCSCKCLVVISIVSEAVSNLFLEYYVGQPNADGFISIILNGRSDRTNRTTYA